jgi:hypothetical protein
MSLKPPSVPADGTTFHGSIRTMPNGEWRASCYVQACIGIDQAVQTRVFETEDEARSWITSIGAARGFKSMTWD